VCICGIQIIAHCKTNPLDFTLKIYKNLLTALQNQGFVFQTFAGFIENPAGKAIILRHDVDDKPMNSLAFARIQAKRNIPGTYYFRAVPQSWNETVIKEIRDLGHEIGYHYESLTTCHGHIDKAFDDFRLNLEKLRQLAPVKTICMHGSPRSPFDSKDIWKHHDYRRLDIIGEPYLDINFNHVLYLTDTGRRWDGWRVSIRDKVPQQDEWVRQGLVYRTTTDIINAANNGRMPDKIMITIHPQRWTDKPLPWLRELLWQNAKNVVKRIIVFY
jgi:hypothetical protein